MLQTMQVNYIRHANALRNTQPQQTRSRCGPLAAHPRSPLNPTTHPHRNQRPVQALFGRCDEVLYLPNMEAHHTLLVQARPRQGH